jgi:hypothetical protein
MQIAIIVVKEKTRQQPKLQSGYIQLQSGIWIPDTTAKSLATSGSKG